ncbi:MAG: HAD family hydrolase [archaeon]
MTTKAVILDVDHTLVMSRVDFSEMKRRIIDYLKSRDIPIKESYVNRATYEIIADVVEYLKREGRGGEVNPTLDDLGEIMTEVELRSVHDISEIEGARKTLEELKRRGIRIGVLTRGSRSYVTQVLTSTRLRDYIDVMGARDDCDKPKPDPTQVFLLMEKMGVNKEETIMVGDHPSDAICARNAGVRFVGVLTGSWGRDLTSQLGSTVIKTIADLPVFLDHEAS